MKIHGYHRHHYAHNLYPHTMFDYIHHQGIYLHYRNDIVSWTHFAFHVHDSVVLGFHLCAMHYPNTGVSCIAIY